MRVMQFLIFYIQMLWSEKNQSYVLLLLFFLFVPLLMFIHWKSCRLTVLFLRV